MVWLCYIALNLISQGAFLDIAVRDIEISLAAFTLAALSEVRAIVAGRVTVPTQVSHAARPPEGERESDERERAYRSCSFL